ncbi:DUF1294 domain-containing protein [Leptolinea tardivitalis]|uniref:DUF1294 domain-containing protein n=1 Tax=Leptolinea tardivitalis TaxID=229920 RepID=A0A0P6XNB6_9CHLR|nr:DUF1294 domain-containing protein [Leptolinea tardivitalis]KPL70448.1 hypothetical protein ADM99_15020 [Leptolinea tardivitalis]GAP22033.1 predicted membrane protein [Leptolinea tardivitalis]
MILGFWYKLALVWYGFSSVTLFGLYGLDKTQAITGGRRIPEKVLHLVAAVGGFPGGFLGRSLFHHKTRKPLFLFILSVSAVLHIIIWVFVFFH